MVGCPAKAGRSRVLICMFCVYILKNSLTYRHYIGCTNDVPRRLDEHNRGQTKSTKQKGEWLMIYKEEYLTEKEAKTREKMIKSYKGGNAFRELLKVRG